MRWRDATFGAPRTGRADSAFGSGPRGKIQRRILRLIGVRCGGFGFEWPLRHHRRPRKPQNRRRTSMTTTATSLIRLRLRRPGSAERAKATVEKSKPCDGREPRRWYSCSERSSSSSRSCFGLVASSSAVDTTPSLVRPSGQISVSEVSMSKKKLTNIPTRSPTACHVTSERPKKSISTPPRQAWVLAPASCRATSFPMKH